jgi:hypothetical protein
VNAIYIYAVSWRKHDSGCVPMDSEVITKSNTDTEILRFDVLDELLERVAKAEQSAVTLEFCTSN